MANPHAGEVDIWLDDTPHRARLTLGALAELETGLAEEGLIDLVERFEARRFSSRDVALLIVAGLRGGGWAGRLQDLLTVRLGDGEREGPIVAAQLAARLLTGAFGPAEV